MNKLTRVLEVAGCSDFIPSLIYSFMVRKQSETVGQGKGKAIVFQTGKEVKMRLTCGSGQVL